ncbi:MAG: enoyl-CoA hydratase/isomerase family protein [Arenicellales bacterium]
MIDAIGKEFMETGLELTHVDFETKGAVAVICLNHPEAGNTLSRQMALDLFAAAKAARDDESIRAVVFSARGPMFSFGGDLKEFKASGTNPDNLIETADQWHEAQYAFLTMPKPVVVGVNGMAAGGGVPMTLVGDIVLVDETARYRLAYTAAGLSPDGGSTWLLPRLIGLRRTQELIMENRELSAVEAVEWGLATRTVPQGSTLDSAISLATRFAAGPTQAFASARRLLHDSFDRDFLTHTAIETREIGANMTGADGQEGLDAFINKRAPIFNGTR